MLSCKALEVIRVPATYTSQACSACGVMDADSRRSQSGFKCAACGHSQNADASASRHVLASATGNCTAKDVHVGAPEDPKNGCGGASALWYVSPGRKTRFPGPSTRVPAGSSVGYAARKRETVVRSAVIGSALRQSLLPYPTRMAPTQPVRETRTGPAAAPPGIRRGSTPVPETRSSGLTRDSSRPRKSQQLTVSFRVPSLFPRIRLVGLQSCRS